MEDIPLAFDTIEGIPAPFETERVIGHDSVGKQLARAYRSGRLHHAWLLSGPRGIGKAGFAYGFAAHLLRYPVPADAPDHVAFPGDGIQSRIARRSHPNVLTATRPWDFDKKRFKTRLTVDEVREVNDFLRSTSAERNWRAVIVDSADDMTESAANALLKVLEEPPPRTMFLVLAHLPLGVLATIRSRCQSIAMKPLDDATLRNVLGELGVLEGVSEQEAERAIALAGGSVRRAIEIIRLEVGGLVAAFLSEIAAAQPDISGVHRIASGLSTATKTAEYELFVSMLLDHIAMQTRALAVSGPGTRERVGALCNLFDRLREEHWRAMTYNMDRKQVILDLFNGLRAA